VFANQQAAWSAHNTTVTRASVKLAFLGRPMPEPVPSREVRSAISRWTADPAVDVLRSGPMTILKWALIFFLVSIVAGILGFTGISAASADVARFLFYVFVVIFLVLLILGLTIFRV
jgi:uncharacterized membrane protein YtjA (UPF0391 family)